MPVYIFMDEAEKLFKNLTASTSHLHQKKTKHVNRFHSEFTIRK